MDARQMIQAIGGPIDPDRVREKALAQLVAARKIAAEQAEDEGLWFEATTATEAYLQHALRTLTRAVEGGQYGPTKD